MKACEIDIQDLFIYMHMLEISISDLVKSLFSPNRQLESQTTPSNLILVIFLQL